MIYSIVVLLLEALLVVKWNCQTEWPLGVLRTSVLNSPACSQINLYSLQSELYQSFRYRNASDVELTENAVRRGGEEKHRTLLVLQAPGH